jgi:hypothetical protein
MKRKNNIGNRIVDARARQRPALTREMLVRRMKAVGVEMSLERLADIERGVCGPNQLELIALAEIVKVSVHRLLTGAPSESTG